MIVVCWNDDCMSDVRTNVTSDAWTSGDWDSMRRMQNNVGVFVCVNCVVRFRDVWSLLFGECGQRDGGEERCVLVVLCVCVGTDCIVGSAALKCG